MLQQSTKPEARRPVLRPKRLDIFLHATKTVRLLATLIREPRIPLVRKFLFLSSVIVLLLILLFRSLLKSTMKHIKIAHRRRQLMSPMRNF